MQQSYYYQFASAYGEGAYGACEYGTSTSCGTTSTDDGLVNTGVAVVGIATLACLIIFAAVVVRIWRRKPKTVRKPNEPPKE